MAVSIVPEGIAGHLLDVGKDTLEAGNLGTSMQVTPEITTVKETNE